MFKAIKTAAEHVRWTVFKMANRELAASIEAGLEERREREERQAAYAAKMASIWEAERVAAQKALAEAEAKQAAYDAAAQAAVLPALFAQAMELLLTEAAKGDEGQAVQGPEQQQQLLLPAAKAPVALLPAAKEEEEAAPAADKVTVTVTVTVAELKAKYGSFRAAKKVTGIKARSWADLAKKLS